MDVKLKGQAIAGGHNLHLHAVELAALAGTAGYALPVKSLQRGMRGPNAFDAFCDTRPPERNPVHSGLPGARA